MTAITISLHDYVDTLRSTMPYMHPAGRATIDAWLAEMNDAADHADAATFAKLAQRVTDKVDQELVWQQEDATPLPTLAR